MPFERKPCIIEEPVAWWGFLYVARDGVMKEVVEGLLEINSYNGAELDRAGGGGKNIVYALCNIERIDMVAKSDGRWREVVTIFKVSSRASKDHSLTWEVRDMGGGWWIRPSACRLGEKDNIRFFPSWWNTP